MWTIDKLINPAHAGKIYEKFYFIGGLEGSVIQVLGIVELIILIAFLVGLHKKFISYGFVLVIHAVSTQSSFKQYLTPFEGPNLLFFAAWPMLVACIALFLLRDEDVILTFRKLNKNN